MYKNFNYVKAKLSFSTLCLGAILALVQPVSAQVTTAKALWEACATENSSTEFDICLSLLEGAVLFAGMKSSGFQICTDEGPQLTSLAQRIGRLGREGAFEQLAHIDALELALAVVVNAYSCP
jgi:hypothetical protein